MGVAGSAGGRKAGERRTKTGTGGALLGVGEEGRADALAGAAGEVLVPHDGDGQGDLVRVGERAGRDGVQARLEPTEHLGPLVRLGAYGELGHRVHGLAAPAPLGEAVLVVRAQQPAQSVVAAAFGEEADQTGGDLRDVEVVAQRLGPGDRAGTGSAGPAGSAGSAGAGPAAGVHLGGRIGSGDREPFGDEAGRVDGVDAERVPRLVAERALAVTDVEGEPADLLGGAGQAEQPVADEAGGDGRRPARPGPGGGPRSGPGRPGRPGSQCPGPARRRPGHAPQGGQHLLQPRGRRGLVVGFAVRTGARRTPPSSPRRSSRRRPCPQKSLYEESPKASTA
ncbi:hypothetical protein GCM10020254_18080 [Streptomyces goshikiensis]